MIITPNIIIKKAEEFLGYTEKPKNSNMTVFGEDYGWNGVAWCMIFMWDIFRMCNASKLFYGGKKTASCTELMNWAKENKQWHKEGQIGDIVIFEFSNGNRHTGMATKINSNGSIESIEGNTSSDEKGSQSNGGCVAKKSRKKSVILGYVRPKYDKPSISYQVHCQTYGWMDWKKDGEMAGTVSESKRIEAIRINPNGIKLKARVHLQGIGWTNWEEFDTTKEFGTIGQSRRLEAIEIVTCDPNIKVQYQGHIQTIGWGNIYTNDTKSNGYSGTVGKGKRLEAIKIKFA